MEQKKITKVLFVLEEAKKFKKDTQVVFPGFQWLFFFLS